MTTMYPAKVNSPATTLNGAIDDSQTTISLVDASVLPNAPNLAVIGTGEDAETILYAAKDGNNLTGCTRGFQGVAKAWDSGTSIARMFTAYDHDTFKSNIETHEAVQTTGVHGSAVAPTVNRLVHRGATGRAQILDPDVDLDIDNKGSRDAAISTHAGLTTAHSAVATATADRIVVRDASARAAFAAPAAAGDALIKGTRLAADEMLDGTSGQFLKAAGAGVNPAYAALVEGDMPVHKSRHAWLGADELRLYSLIPNIQHIFVDWQTFDMWTESNTETAAQTPSLLNLLLETGATSGSVAKRRTSNNAIPPYDIAENRFTYNMQNWGVLQTASIIWIAIFRNTDTPSDTAIHVGWKIINGRIYATNANGTTQTITDTGDTNLNTSAWKPKRLTHVCEEIGTIKFYIGDNLKATHTTNLPTPGSSAGRFILQIENTDAIDQKVSMRPIYISGRLLS